MRSIVIAAVAALSLTGCTSTEKDVGIGTATGAVVGGIVGGGRGAVIGAGAGAVGGLLVRNLRNGNCEYRDRNGRIYTARCR